jgi:hypothetical protein
MSLFFIGCSHTYGDDLIDPDRQGWPALVARAKNQAFINLAVSGGTNDRNLYHTIKHSDQYQHFYIAWTYTERFTKYREDNNFEINWNPALINTHYGKDDSFRLYGKIHYAYWNNQLYNFKQWLQKIILLQKYLESKNKTYTMINSCSNNIKRWTSGWSEFNSSVKSLLCFDFMNDDQLLAEYQEIQTLVNEINFDHYLGWGEWSIVDLTQSYPTGATKHLLEQGHRAVADYILTYDTN